MRKNALRFLVDLSKDAQKREAFQRNPGAVLESAGINDEEAKAVLGGGDWNAIGRYLEVNPPEEEQSSVMVMVMS